MNRSLVLTTVAIDEPALIRQRLMSDGMGAVVYFLGVVRSGEGGRTVRALEYEAFASMVDRQFDLIFQEIERRWPIESIRVVHRTGEDQYYH